VLKSNTRRRQLYIAVTRVLLVHTCYSMCSSNFNFTTPTILARGRGPLFFRFAHYIFPLYIKRLNMARSLASSKQSDIKITNFRK
jgi:hypothetical protein